MAGTYFLAGVLGFGGIFGFWREFWFLAGVFGTFNFSARLEFFPANFVLTTSVLDQQHYYQ